MDDVASSWTKFTNPEDAFWKMYELLLENRKKLHRSLYEELAVEIGLDRSTFLAELNGEAVRDIVAADIALSRKLGVKGTPTMFLNGRRIPELLQGPVFWKAVVNQGLSTHEEAGLPLVEPLAGLDAESLGESP